MASATASRPPITLIVLTYNEERNLEHCLESAKGWVDEIIIVDSFSSDGTLGIAQRYTDRIYQHTFENQAKQFNWAVDCLPVKGDWILRLDADEMLTPELGEEMVHVLPMLPEDVTGLFLRRRVYFMGRWIRWGGYYPRWFIRLFREGHGRYEEIGQEHLILAGKSRRLTHDFVDYNRKGLTFWTDKHNHWATAQMLDNMAFIGERSLPEQTVKPSLFGTQEQRLRWLNRNVYVRTPLFLRSFAYFFYRYFLLLGFLDGREGLIFHVLQGFWYRFYVDAKTYEARKLGIAHATLRIEYTRSEASETSPNNENRAA